jgi:hypothetical protein
VVCACDEQWCQYCICTTGCRVCKEYECTDCQQDTEKPKIFKEWHEKSHFTCEDEYGRRPACPYQPMLNVQRCLHCRKSICHGCGHECTECHRLSCSRCKEDLSHACRSCREIIEKNDDSDIGSIESEFDIGLIDRDFDIGPIDREEDDYVCRPCFDQRPQICGCGEPSYDPHNDHSGRSSHEDPDNSDENPGEGPDESPDEDPYEDPYENPYENPYEDPDEDPDDLAEEYMALYED